MSIATDKNKTIPVICINWNGLQDTIECVDSLCKQTLESIEIFLVDNGSEANEANILKDRYSNNSKVKFFANPENLGFARAHNEIFKIIINDSKYEYIALLNNDAIAEENWLELLLKNIEETKAGMIGSKLIDYYDRKLLDTVGHDMLNTGEILPIGHGESIDKYNESFEPFGVCAGACLYSVEMIKDIGVFDDYFITGYEDVELGARAVLLGYKSIFEPKAIVYHKGQTSINKIRSYEFSLKVQKNIYYTYFKLMPIKIILLNLPFILLKIIAISLLSIIFWRPKLLKITLIAFYELLKYDYEEVRKKRSFFMKRKKISSWQIIKKQEFFLGYYLEYFRKFIILKKPTVLERY